jgi:hypothetical protein
VRRTDTGPARAEGLGDDPSPDAEPAWNQVRRAVTSDVPRPLPDGRIVWTAGVWQGNDGDMALVLTGRC